MKLLDIEHPFYAPLWRRVAILAVILVWAAVEFLTGSTGWGAGCTALAAYCAYQFFVVFRAADPKDDGAQD